MELHQLECFLAVVESGSFRAASERLHKAQSAVSIAIKSLEDQLEFALFDRSEYRPRLTPQGRHFLPLVKNFLQQEQHLKDYGVFLSKGFEPLIRLGISNLWPSENLVPILQNFVLQFPFTEIIVQQETLSADELLEANKIDLSIGEVGNEKQLFEIRSVQSIKMIPVCAPTHPLAKLRGHASRHDLLKHRQIVLKSTVQESTRIAGVEPGQPQIGVQDFAMKKELLLRGVGWGAMPEHMVFQEIKKKKLIITHKATVEVPLFLAWSKKRALGPCAQFLISAFSDKKIK